VIKDLDGCTVIILDHTA
jgi:hypothetical protein